ncbi:unnamed protein product [Clonostachys rhizophaga]|uniref:Reelin domain-containing protein n=1 Tax=Clonostachys rhizophaga TaxID=160324 RepID=A0A9N9VVA1_9HYPO|nr:unnamed protein product [Clonostachys rhizophaga]
MAPIWDIPDPASACPRLRKWVHAVLEKFWGGQGYLPEKLLEEEPSIPATTLGALANVFILASSRNMQCQSLWEEGGVLHECWVENEEVLSWAMCLNAQIKLQSALGIDCSGDEKQPRCDMGEFRELGGPENEYADMATKLSNFIAELERKFESAKEPLPAPGQDAELLQAQREDKTNINSAIRLPIADFILEHQLHCCGGGH